jgi:hypothetical protein
LARGFKASSGAARAGAASETSVSGAAPKPGRQQMNLLEFPDIGLSNPVEVRVSADVINRNSSVQELLDVGWGRSIA